MNEDEVIRKPLLSGWCSTVSTDPVTGETSHERCERLGGGQRANPAKEFQPCPCPCHYGEEFECGGCGRTIREAPLWPYDVDGDLRYTHIDRDGRAVGEDCAT